MSYWANRIGAFPRFLWKMDETSGSAAIDSVTSDGSADHGAYMNTPLLAQMNLIANEPLSLAPYFHGGVSGPSSFIQGTLTGDASGAATTAFTYNVWLRVPALDVNRHFGAKASHCELRILTNGVLGFYLYPTDWIYTDVADAIAINTTYMLTFQLRGGRQTIWINGVKKKDVAFGGPIDNSGNPWMFGKIAASNTFRGWACGVEVHIINGLSDAAILAAYNNGILIPNDPPTVPGPFTVPLGGAAVDDITDVSWGASTEPEGSPITYEGEYTLNNSTWVSLFPLQSATIFLDWNTSGFAATDLARVRVRAYDATGGGYSDWRTGDLFNIAHISEPPIITLTVLARTDNSVLVAAAFYDPDEGASGEHNATQYEIDVLAGTYSPAKLDTGWLTDYRKAEAWFTSLPANTALKIRGRARDVGGQVGPWHELRFRSRRAQQLSAAAGYGFDQFRNEGTHPDAATIAATYGQLFFMVGFTPTWPILAAAEYDQHKQGRGYRIGWESAADNYIQPIDSGDVAQVGVQAYTRYGGAAINPVTFMNEDGWPEQVGTSFMFIFQPHPADPPGKQVLFGSESWWVFRSGSGIAVRSAPWESFYSVGGLNLNATNILIGTYKQEQCDSACMYLDTPIEDRIIIPGKMRWWLNGTAALQIGLLDNDNEFPVTFPYQFSGLACPDFSNSYTMNGVSFGLGISPHNYLWVGTQSSDGARDIYDSNYYGFSGMSREFAWWPDRLLTNDDVDEIMEAYNSPDPETLAVLLKEMNPLIYDRFRQPHQPKKPTIPRAVVTR